MPAICGGLRRRANAAFANRRTAAQYARLRMSRRVSATEEALTGMSA